MTNTKHAAHIEVEDVEKRRAQIAALVKQAKADSQTQPFNDHPGGAIDLPRIKIRNNWLVYRMENRRTWVRQLGWAKKYGLDDSYFRTGEENDEAQRDQHEILFSFTDRDDGSIKSIYDVLEEEKVQREPLLITYEGVVVNGNRRLSAMRELYARHVKGGPDSRANPFEMFDYVSALVLPTDTDHRTISKIEIKLQMSPETRLPYSWVDVGLALRDMRDNEDMSLDELAALMKLGSAREVSERIESVQEAENYLNEYLQRPGEYELVVTSGLEQHFKTVQQLLAGKKGKTGAEQDLARAVSYVIAGNPRAFEGHGRTYDFRQAYGEQVKPILESLKETFADEYQQAAEELSQTAPGDGEFDQLFEVDTPDPYEEFVPLKKILLDPEKGMDVASTVITTFEELNTRKRGEDREQYALRCAVQVRTKLAEIHLDSAAPATHRRIQAQLEASRQLCEDLIADLSRRTLDKTDA